MRIHVGVTMAGEMFGTRYNAIVLQAAHILNRVISDFKFIFTKRSKIDDGVVGIVIDICIRCKIDMNT